MNLSNKDIYLQYALSQFLPFGEVRRGSSFNAYNSMKAYSYNGERYGYYGYDASGERTYKYDMYSAGSWTNQTGGMNVSLQIDKMMLYPNGYLNMNQNGEYTKHYYADALRIASKIGNGFSQDLCTEANQIGNEVDSTYLDERGDRQYVEMKEELSELIHGNQVIDVLPIPYPDTNLCNLSGSGIETALFFYHPDHLGSTGMVTDNSSNITQGMLYAPFGEIICDYNPTFHDSPMPNYAFNAKELDEENNMYYYSARYYAPPTFISRDPMFEKYPSISPYTYCANNPLKFVDPDGMMYEKPIKLFGADDKVMFHKVADEFEYEVGDGIFYVFAHSLSIGIQYTDNEGKIQIAFTPEEVKRLLCERSPEFRQAMEKNKKITLIILGCNTTSNSYVQKNGVLLETDKTISEQITKKYSNITVLGADGKVVYGYDNKHKPRILGVRNENNDGGFWIVVNGNKTHKIPMPYNSDKNK